MTIEDEVLPKMRPSSAGPGGRETYQPAWRFAVVLIHPNVLDHKPSLRKWFVRAAAPRVVRLGGGNLDDGA